MVRAAAAPGQSRQNGHAQALREGAEHPSPVLLVDGMVAGRLAVVKVVKVFKVFKYPVARQTVTWHDPCDMRLAGHWCGRRPAS